MPATVIEKLQSLLADHHLARIARSGVSSVNGSYFVLAISPTLVVLENEEEFLLNGYSIVNVADITAVRSSRTERFHERMLRAESVAPRLPAARIDLTDWRSALKSLLAYGKNLIIECETGDEDLDEFFIGRIETLNKASVSFRHFDALGQWDDEPTTIRFRNITRVRFEERYIEVYSKFLKTP